MGRSALRRPIETSKFPPQNSMRWQRNWDEPWTSSRRFPNHTLGEADNLFVRFDSANADPFSHVAEPLRKV
jgi:hypothetical protein